MKPSRIVNNCHIRHVVQDFLSSPLFDKDDDKDLQQLLQQGSVSQQLKKGVLVTLSGLLQQRYADRITALIVTAKSEAEAVGERLVPVSAEMEAVVGRMREGGVVEEVTSAHDAHVCMKWRQILVQGRLLCSRTVHTRLCTPASARDTQCARSLRCY